MIGTAIPIFQFDFHAMTSALVVYLHLIIGHLAIHEDHDCAFVYLNILGIHACF